ncbi:N-acetylmuramoyl-L-alanine amidase [Larsenimonas suaedae]|uniref:N-acetylmuramoyl-L-alanine amidase n=1 Tax=Larsenimonas suaedae TaxID=1851019 RepID=A0ABU1GZM4_9GAMM|nr:N-acetylmuramoyl-L-alanine amidase [Larsenimonas suaedae]MCM2972858.1 N-acetylmuramoyl-L-alanine amidase [Larsenimonas suaedae]MDR5896957.1 N-acetylmuramoyl-L-alanine amidase [Larsenimonas suaedae]
MRVGALRSIRALCVIVGIALAQSAFAATLTSLDVKHAGGTTALEFDLAGKPDTNVFALDNPARLVADFSDTRKVGSIEAAASKSALIKAVRSGPRNQNDLRVVIDLSHAVTFEVAPIRKIGSDGYRLEVVLEGGDSDEGDPIEAIIRSRENAATEALAKRSSTTATRAEPASRKPAVAHPRRDIVVVVDAGHGGKDPGAVGPHGVYEKTVVLQMAKRLAATFNAAPGFKAYLTRDRDIFIPLRGRTRIARDRHADFFVSLHADAARSSSARGSSVFALSQHGATSESARWLAKSENNSDLIGGVGGDLSLDDKDEMLRGVLLDLSMTATINDSLAAGTDVFRQIERVNRIRHGRVEQAGFVVLKSPDIPSLLVETGFITNPSEERLLQQASHQQQLMNAVYAGIRAHFERQPPPDSLLAWQRDQARGGARDEYRVSAGDTLSSIAGRFNVSILALKQANRLSSDVLRVGQILNIP